MAGADFCLVDDLIFSDWVNLFTLSFKSALSMAFSFMYSLRCRP